MTVSDEEQHARESLAEALNAALTHLENADKAAQALEKDEMHQTLHKLTTIVRNLSLNR